MKRALAVLAAVLCMAAAPEPSERLPDAAQEARARALFREIRCVVCQNEAIDGSEAELAADLRALVREQVAAGRTDAEVRRFLVARYGDFVLFRPAFDARTALLWLAPFALVLGVGGALLSQARRRMAAAPGGLTPDEEARLKALTDGGS